MCTLVVQRVQGVVIGLVMALCGLLDWVVIVRQPSK